MAAAIYRRREPAIPTRRTGSIPICQGAGRPAQPGLVRRHHLHPASRSVAFSNLVAVMDWATSCAGAGGCRTPSMLGSRRGLERGAARYGTPDLQYRPGQASSPAPDSSGYRWNGRCRDNIFIERLWRSLKYEAVYLHELADGFRAESGDWRVDRLLQHRAAAIPRWPDRPRPRPTRPGGGLTDLGGCPHSHRKNKQDFGADQTPEYTLTSPPNCRRRLLERQADGRVVGDR